MSMTPYPGQGIAEALNTSGSCRLVPSDGVAGTLSGNLLQRHLHEATGLDVQAPAGPGIHSAFNSKVAATDQLKAPATEQPAMAPAPAPQAFTPTSG